MLLTAVLSIQFLIIIVKHLQVQKNIITRLKKYYYKISYSSSYSYTIISYSGSYYSGYLYVTSDDDDLYQTIKMTSVYIYSEKSLPTSTSENKYFYLINGEYSSYSGYIYILLEDNGFSLSYSNIKYCRTNTNPNSYPDSAVRGCSFSYVSYYKSQTSSSTKKYYYKISYSRVKHLQVQKNIITRFPIVALIVIPLFLILVVILLDIFMLLVMMMIYIKQSR